jgi:hypothetical protein
MCESQTEKEQILVIKRVLLGIEGSTHPVSGFEIKRGGPSQRAKHDALERKRMDRGWGSGGQPPALQRQSCTGFTEKGKNQKIG